MEKLSIGATYAVTLTGIVLDGDTTRKTILFVLGLILIFLQIVLHVMKIQRERRESKEYEKEHKKK